jgi:hypothetical protein
MPVVFSFRNQSNNRKLHIHFLVKQLAVISSYSGNYKRPVIRRPISRSNQHRFVSQLANALSNHPIVQPIPGISVALKIGYRTESSMRLIASKARNRNGFDSLPDSLKIAMPVVFWICTIHDHQRAGKRWLLCRRTCSRHPAVTALHDMRPRAAHCHPVLPGVSLAEGIAALALVMSLAQGFDGIIGILANDPAKTYGPFVFALVNFVGLVWLLRSQKGSPGLL